MPVISKTTDGGTTWTNMTLNFSLSGDAKVKFVTGSGVAYLLNNGIIIRSLNNCATWNSMPTAGVTGLYYFDFNRINNIIFGYAVLTDGRVIRLADAVALTGIETENNNMPGTYRLDQNYPNPFNPSTTIGFDIPEDGFVTLEVYNVLGSLVSELVNKSLRKGHYSYNWDALHQSSGIYFYRLSVTDPSSGSGKNFTETKKMSLIK